MNTKRLQQGPKVFDFMPTSKVRHGRIEGEMPMLALCIEPYCEACPGKRRHQRSHPRPGCNVDQQITGMIAHDPQRLVRTADGHNDFLIEPLDQKAYPFGRFRNEDYYPATGDCRLEIPCDGRRDDRVTYGGTAHYTDS
jgi:hypothetical protein